MAEWYEPPKKGASWWDNTAHNGAQACHPVIAGLIGLGTNMNGSITMAKTVHQELGFTTPVSIAARASTWAERFNLTLLTGTVYCGASYLGGGIDALYQSTHNQEHLGTHIMDWYNDHKHVGIDVYNWFDDRRYAISKWWENDHHWWS